MKLFLILGTSLILLLPLVVGIFLYLMVIDSNFLLILLLGPLLYLPLIIAAIVMASIIHSLRIINKSKYLYLGSAAGVAIPLVLLFIPGIANSIEINLLGTTLTLLLFFVLALVPPLIIKWLRVQNKRRVMLIGALIGAIPFLTYLFSLGFQVVFDFSAWELLGWLSVFTITMSLPALVILIFMTILAQFLLLLSERKV